MNAIRDVWENIETGLRRHGLDDREIIQKTTQVEYYRLCEYTDWQLLRRSASVAVASTGTRLPADLIGIMAVMDSNGDEIMPAEQQTREFGGWNKKCWHFVQSGVTPLFERKALTVERDATAITVDPALDSTAVGEYAVLGSEPGFYKLASATALETPYRGPRLDKVTITVRPRTVKMLAVTDASGDASAETVTVHYWAYPEPLYQEWQIPLLPTSRILELRTIINILGFQEKQERAADNYRNEFLSALSDALRLNPKFRVPVPPQAAAGLGLKFGRR